MRQVSDEELIEMGMHDLVAQRREILRKNAMDAGDEPPAPSESCVMCRETMQHMQREFDTEAVRTYVEVETYLGEMCDDMDGWYKPKVVQWCRDNVLQNKQMINGLVQMYSGNLVESVCALGLKICDKDDPADLTFEQLEKGEEVVLEKPTPGCLGAPGTIGIVKSVGIIANKKQYLVEAVDKSCESWYEEGYVARRNMSEALLSTMGKDSDAKPQGGVEAPAHSTAKEAPGATAHAVRDEMQYPEAKKVLAAAAKARRKAMIKVEEAEKALHKAERRLEAANEAYAAASSAAEAAKEKWDQEQGDDTVVRSVPVSDPQGEREL